ncbi:MAG: tRNA (adenosine(37)-N6)-threonylcarbamoyltransferase complex transferase subunit TsaD, partial [bacterium]|nr:tRNA (adenosine(37)-N6)-threonylcarbamoyltransferase complex transferase subunit TsaD [bacterium]
FKLPRPMMREDNFDFSFAGLKTAVLKIVGAKENLDDDFRKKIAREFEDAAADVLVSKTLRAVEEFGVNTLVVGGGVSANTYIRLRLAEALAEVGGTSLLVSPPELATDNAIMIALCGYFHAQKSNFADPALLTATGNLRLS